MLESRFITRNKELLGGIPVFSGTRVPVKTFFDYLQGGHSLEEFLDDFPTVKRDQAEGVLELVKQWLVDKSFESVA